MHVRIIAKDIIHELVDVEHRRRVEEMRYWASLLVGLYLKLKIDAKNCVTSCELICFTNPYADVCIDLGVCNDYTKMLINCHNDVHKINYFGRLFCVFNKTSNVLFIGAVKWRQMLCASVREFDSNIEGDYTISIYALLSVVMWLDTKQELYEIRSKRIMQTK